MTVIIGWIILIISILPVCRGQCPAGWTGASCQTPCMDGMWGVDCLMPCGNCYNGTVCNKTSGECPVTEGNPPCSAGYRYSDRTCRTPCTLYRWGPDCDESCGRCYQGDVCDRVSGECPPENPRCSSGYKGLHCTPCDPGTWGNNCVFTCSEHCVSHICKATTGGCEGGCTSGYTGKRCDKALVADYTGTIAGGVSSGAVITALFITMLLVLRDRKRRQRGSTGEGTTPARNTGVTQEVPHSGAPNRGHDSV